MPATRAGMTRPTAPVASRRSYGRTAAAGVLACGPPAPLRLTPTTFDIAAQPGVCRQTIAHLNAVPRGTSLAGRQACETARRRARADQAIPSPHLCREGCVPFDPEAAESLSPLLTSLLADRRHAPIVWSNAAFTWNDRFVHVQGRLGVACRGKDALTGANKPLYCSVSSGVTSPILSSHLPVAEDVTGRFSRLHSRRKPFPTQTEKRRCPIDLRAVPGSRCPITLLQGERWGASGTRGPISRRHAASTVPRHCADRGYQQVQLALSGCVRTQGRRTGRHLSGDELGRSWIDCRGRGAKYA